MNASTATRRLDDLDQALIRLEEALAVPESAPLAIDGTIQRFEFVFELCWKAMKALIEFNTPSASANTARAAIKAAFAAGWIEDETAWLDLLDMRNATSHTYREAVARDVYRRIGLRVPMIRAAMPGLRAQLP
ncbi:MAG TPA: HI0074 family nucleotidyltransferase substrate-binding subunit [Rhizomicrobium sp.]